MKNRLNRSKKLQYLILFGHLLTFGRDALFPLQAEAQNAWKSVYSYETAPSPVIWDLIPDSVNLDTSNTSWELIDKFSKQKFGPKKVLWELLKPHNHEAEPPISGKESNSMQTIPTSLEEAEALLNIIPLKPNDYDPLLNLSYAVPTASVLNKDEWRAHASTISPFKYSSGTGNQNYLFRLDYGLSNSFQVSGFYSEADDPLNSSIKDLDIRPANFWEVYGAAIRWRFLEDKNWSIALNSSLENWTVGSGGSDSFGTKSRDSASPNIFNDSGKRVETNNLIGSISLPLTWNTNSKWQYTFAPGISFLPASQGKGQGGAGEFYGINPYISGGLLWHPIPEIGFTASVSQPLGNGTNNFDRNLRYTKVPILSWGLNWHLNPRIALQGQLTNGFGATPATAILALPSDNRISYSTSLVYTADAPDTPQPALNQKQQSLSLGGFTVNTALVPPDMVSLFKASADSRGNLDTTYGLSLSNIFHIDFYRSESKNIPQTTEQARKFMNDSGTSWRGSGKAVLTSPLRGAPIWSALRISLGRNMDAINNSANGYLFAETPLTWEANSAIAFNISPKIAWTGVGNLLGIGIGANIQLAPHLELIPEANIVLNSQQQNNNTIGLRWNAFDDIAIEAFGSTASSIIDIGQLLNAEEIRWGCRLIIKI